MSTIGMLLLSVTAWSQNSIWVSAYYAGWMQGNNEPKLPVQMIDFGGVTRIIHFSILPNPDGSLDDLSNSVDATQAAEIVQACHAAGKRVLISIGGWDTEARFAGATAPEYRTGFINNLLEVVQSRGYDGIDIDWEPISDANTSRYRAFITGLRSAMKTQNPNLELTAAVGWQPALFAELAGSFDQVNLMTYDMSGPWDGWVTWHNAPVSDGEYTFPSTGGRLPSANKMVDEYLAAGVPAAKIGIGIDFYGYIWSGGEGTPTGGVTGPRQAWTTAPAVTDGSYAGIMKNYAPGASAKWDTIAQAAYLSIDGEGSAQDMFISYDNDKSCAAKIAYVKNKPIGGVIIWELGGGWRPSEPTPDLLLQAVKQAAFPGTRVKGEDPSIAMGMRLAQNYPNPFNPTTKIQLTIVNRLWTIVKVFDVLGREVATLMNEVKEPGTYNVQFDASHLASGVYIYRITAGEYVESRKMILMK